MVYIDKVHYETDYYGNEYIARVAWTRNSNSWATQACTKKEMISFINQKSSSLPVACIAIIQVHCITSNRFCQHQNILFRNFATKKAALLGGFLITV